MSAPIRLCLNLMVIEQHGRPQPFADLDVQVWQGDKHVKTIELVKRHSFQWPEHADKSTIEDYALNALRVVARMAADVQMTAVEQGSLHLRTDFEQADDHVQ